MGRTYDIGEYQYPSVTTILDILDKPALIGWAAKTACQYVLDNYKPDMVLADLVEKAKKEWRNVSTEAMDIGSEIHNLIEVYIKEGKDAVGEMRPEVENGFLAFLEWEKENIEEWICSELTVSDSGNCYAGTLDAVAKLKNGKTYVIDFKSSSGFWPGYDMQIAAYRNAYSLMPDAVNIDGMAVLRLDKATGEPEWKDYSKVFDAKLDAFIKLLDYYYAAAKRRCKNPRTKK